MREKLYAAPYDTTAPVPLSSAGKTRTVRKQIFRHGQEFVHPLDKTTKVTVTPEFEDSLLRNFRAKTTPIVQFPIVDDQNRHVEGPDYNRGEVIGLERTATGLDAIIEVRKNADDVGSTLIGASALYHPDYEDTETGRKCGPTLLHVAGTNRPYLRHLEPFRDVVALSGRPTHGADTWGEVDLVALSATDGPVTALEEAKMNKAELIAALLALPEGERVDVAALQEQVALSASAGPETPVALSGPKATEVATALGLEATETITVDDLADSLVELSGQVSGLVAAKDTAETALKTELTRQATKTVDALIGSGAIEPSLKDYYVGLSMEQPAVFEKITKTKAPNGAVPLSGPVGVDTHEDTTVTDEQRVADASDRYAGGIRASQPKGRRGRATTAA